MKSFLRVFTNILHAIEGAAVIAAPIVSAVDPVIGALMTQATTVAVGVEAAITAPSSGDQRQQVVTQTTQNTVALINSLLSSQGKPTLPVGVVDAVTAATKSVVQGLNTVADAVAPVTPPAK